MSFPIGRVGFPLLSLRLRLTAAVTLLFRLRPFLGTEPLRHPVDVAVRCLGWRATLPAGLEETGPVNVKAEAGNQHVGGDWMTPTVFSCCCYVSYLTPAFPEASIQ